VALSLAVGPEPRALEQRAGEVPKLAPVELDLDALRGHSLGRAEIGADVARAADAAVADDVPPALPHRFAHDARRGIVPE
jgi:hypothetical protein